MSENQEETAAVAEEAPVVEEPEAVKKPKTSKSKEETAAKKKGEGMTSEEIMNAIKNMTVLELADLVKALEEEFGVSAAVPTVAAVAAPGEGATTSAAATEEKTEFNVILQNVGANKINVIKAVRELTSLGLKESKDLVEGAPQPVRENVTKEEAATAKEKLEAAGATVQVT